MGKRTIMPRFKPAHYIWIDNMFVFAQEHACDFDGQQPVCLSWPFPVDLRNIKLPKSGHAYMVNLFAQKIIASG